jgi:hypothetical protein
VISPEVLLTRRQSLVNLKVCTASAAKTPRGLFGVPLEKNALPCFQYIPLVVLRCIRAVELFGMKEVGIYRVSGNKTVIDEFKVLLCISVLCSAALYTASRFSTRTETFPLHRKITRWVAEKCRCNNFFN